MESGEGAWQTVTRRRRNPNTTFQPYKPLTSPISTTPTTIQSTQSPSLSTMAASPPDSPKNSQATFYISPHSPTQLRFPPSAQFAEWRGRCFRCCRTGHSISQCRNSMRCGKCWGEGHVSNRCTTKTLNPAAMPYWSNKLKQQPKPSTRSFQELLDKPSPLAGPTMPANRPSRLAYYALPDQSNKDELLRLSRAVVFDTHGKELGFSTRDIVGFATRTGIVEEKELTIGQLAKDRFLIVLPVGMAPETFINSTCPALWDAGFSFQPWSPMDRGKLALPEYKVLIDISGVPPHLCKEQDVARATTIFGTYLGLVPNKDPEDVSSWRVAVAVDRLERVPLELEFHVQGIKFVAQVSTYNWMRSPFYTAAELPKLPPKFTKPRPSASNGWQIREEPIAVSRSVLLKLYHGRDIQDLPEEVREMLQSMPRDGLPAGESLVGLVTTPDSTATHDTPI